MKQKFGYIIIILFIGMSSFGQTQIKVMSYNLLHYPTGTGIDRKDDLRYIVNDYQPDIFVVCELEDYTGADEIINYCLQTPDNRYEAASFTPNHSGSHYALQQMLYYNSQKFELINETYLTTYVRDINHYTLKLRTQTPDTIDVYVAHLKASGGTTNENERLDMVNVMTNDLQNIPSSHFVIFAGDFNLYNSDESAYQEMIDPTNAVVLKDPINLLGNWHNNYNIREYVTQSTHSASGSDYVGGGLDDRFDFIMLSENLINNSHLQYLNNSYKSYGNNGNCFNDAINDNSCAGSDYSTELRNHLFTMSDHLPVVLTLESNQSLAISEELLTNKCHIIGSNIVKEQIRIFTDNFKPVLVEVYNSLGQSIIQISDYKSNETINISTLHKGMYLIRLQYENNIKILKFVKTD
jgi:endonuclease/exonuclease/phosphatase family metal-dependent hydrolase